MKEANQYRDEIEALTALVARISDQGAAISDEAVHIKADAERLSVRLSGHVRVALVGRVGSGKANLLSFLLGEVLAPDGFAAGQRPTIMVNHADDPYIVAGWWDGRRNRHEGTAMAAAMAERPEYLEFGRPLQVLETMSFTDMPASADDERQLRNLKWLVPRADVILWAKSAAEAWSPEEADLWRAIPASLRDKSLLVATEADQAAPETFDEIAARLTRETDGAFHEVRPIATATAIAAAPGGVVKDKATWQQTGARELLLALIDRTKAVRLAQLDTARGVLEAAEVLEDAPEAPTQQAAIMPGRPTARDGGRAGSQGTGDALSNSESVVLGQLHDRIGILIRKARGGTTFKEEAFLMACTNVLDDLAFMIADRKAMLPDTLWVNEAVEEATDRLAELSLQGDRAAAEEAAGLLLQLSKDLSWTVAA